ncbi:MAG TPA: ankyrin repeat domain-containing protein [Steroidobacteraceae bacterium]|nr:ankyrin repeat domain-containing protein [Steroidobacteraceae bacterium]
MFKSTLRAGGSTAALGLLLLGAAAFSYADSGPQSLVDLVRSGEREAVLAAITSPAVDVNLPAPDGSTALMWATYNVDHELVRALLKDGAKVNLTNRYGDSALAEAVKLGDVELVRMLLDAGANPDSPNQDGETALMLASSIGSLPIAELLIKRGATVNAVEIFRGQTALMWAAAENHPEVVDLLLKHGADVKVRAKYDDWPREMTSEPRAQFRQTGGLTALLYATRSGCYRCAVAIVNAGADVNQPNPDGITPLINAIDNRAYDIAMFLLDKGANPSAWDMSGRTPLYVAVDMHSYVGRSGFGNGNFAGFGEPLAERLPNKATAMDLVNRLLAMGVDPNHELTRMRPNGNGRGRFADYMMRGGTTPLMIATLSYDDVAIRALLAHGAAVNIPNVFEITPLMAAAGMSGSARGGVGSAIGGGGSRKPEDVQALVLKTVDLLLAAGANVNARVTDSHTHTAKLVAYVQGRDHEGQTALFAAAEEGWDRVVKDLLDRGADPNVHDDRGKIALDYARHPPPLFRGPAAAARRSRSEEASRAATVALLEALVPKSGAGATADLTE